METYPGRIIYIVLPTSTPGLSKSDFARPVAIALRPRQITFRDRQHPSLQGLFLVYDNEIDASKAYDLGQFVLHAVQFPSCCVIDPTYTYDQRAELRCSDVSFYSRARLCAHIYL